ncbi:PREDICTED: uncharacterized protein LOC109477200 [Branchiostoma belcheri]|uniref:Uncharacterized protein LOC109477200 n=1 Tax=Branchiostoma belcheri TaxID=7741 RepID=A0A6P4ZB21_BRABE|nr:PREDICTED: uncharacterized protein LOC109477200 [Branchiostoma belcheri]
MAYNGKYMHGMGWTLVVMGSLNIILGIAADAAFASMGADTVFHFISAPIWNGIFVVITGILAINSGKKPTSKGLMVAVMVLGIFTILSALCCFSLGITGSIVDGMFCGYRYGYGYGYSRYRNYDCTAPAIALHVVNVLLALAEIVMGFVAAIMPCCGLASPNNPNVVITGILAINSGKKPTSKGLMVAVMILGIFTILTALCCFSIGVAGAIVDPFNCSYHYNYPYGYRSYRFYDCATPAIALHVVNVLLALAEIVMGFVAAIMPCCGLASPNNPNVAPVVVYNQHGPNMAPGQAAYVIVQTGVPGTGAQGVPYTTVSAAGGMPQQQVFIAQHPYAAGAPMQQGYYGAQAPPPYMPQSTIGAAAGQPPATGQPPAGPPEETKTQPPA